MKRSSKSGEKPLALSDDALHLVARRFAVLAEPMRLRILNALCDGERNVSTLVEATGATQTNVSRHLQVLATNGLVARRREGVQAYYRVKDPSLFELCRLVCGSLEEQLTEGARILR
jgi:DNA-binding transcriptional ArsR family regulator